MTKKNYRYAPDPEGCLIRPKTWPNKKSFPYIAMDSDGAWFAFTHEVTKSHYFVDEGMFKVNTSSYTRITSGAYPYFHFSTQQCLDSIYQYQPSDKDTYCPVCDGYGGTLQPCHGCGRPANSPCASSLDGVTESKKKKKKKLAYYPNAVHLEAARRLVKNTVPACTSGQCSFKTYTLVKGSNTPLVRCDCGNWEKITTVTPSLIAPEIKELVIAHT